MSDIHVVEHLTAYLSGDLDEAASHSVGDHLASCPACAGEYEAMRTVWDALGRIPEELPRPSLRRNFLEMLSRYDDAAARAGSRRVSPMLALIPGWFRPGRPAVQAACAAVLAVGSFACGYFLSGGGRNPGEMAELRQEVHALNNLLTVSLLHQESASERLKGVSLGSRGNGSDPDIASALIYAMNHDRNVNVRLAALDALSRDIGTSGVRGEIIRTFPEQSSPLMQIALVDVLVQINDPESREVLQQALTRPGLLPDVRERIGQGIRQIL
jgi:hypothetical protein